MLLYLFVFMRTNLCNAPVIVENTYTVARGYYSIANINLRTMVAVQRTIQGSTNNCNKYYGASNTVLHSKIAMYADDIALYSIIESPSD